MSVLPRSQLIRRICSSECGRKDSAIIDKFTNCLIVLQYSDEDSILAILQRIAFFKKCILYMLDSAPQ